MRTWLIGRVKVPQYELLGDVLLVGSQFKMWYSSTKSLISSRFSDQFGSRVRKRFRNAAFGFRPM
jgi:hypothetical protein